MGKISEKGIMKEGSETLPSQHSKALFYYSRSTKKINFFNKIQRLLII
jgi:hypothetical protein